ncbi:methionine aminopeptidase [Bacillus piscicola]|uniref:methionine aminopeptidase n=1 Tax=Bacillus piscicola TaxID=1632684 RepID=UPI001F09CD9C|nr:methionine aminopeptidase [Bacillus piscicola]
MNVWQSFKDWRQEKYEQKIDKMRVEGKCPDCRGKGFTIMSGDYLHASPLDCAGCNGSGVFSDWEK